MTFLECSGVTFVECSGVTVIEWVCKADLLSDHFDSKQSREAVDRPLNEHPSPSLTTFAFRSTGQESLIKLGPLWCK